MNDLLPDGRSSSSRCLGEEGKIREWTSERLVVSNQLGSSGGNRYRGVYTWVGISAIGHFHRTWGGGTGETDRGGGREGVQMAERKVAGRSRGSSQSLGIGWRLFSASTSISCFQRCNEFVFFLFFFILARSLTRACGSRFAMERTGIGSSRITGNYSIRPGK